MTSVEPLLTRMTILYICPNCENTDSVSLSFTGSISCSNCGFEHTRIKIIEKKELRELKINSILDNRNGKN